MNASVINILSAIIIFQLALLVLFLFTSTKGKRLSNRILAFFFLWLIINLGDGLLSYYGFYESFPSLAHLEDGFIFLVGPLVYFYILSMVYRDFSFEKSNLLHLLPFVIITTAYQIYYHRQPEGYQKLIQNAIANQNLPFEYYLVIGIVYLHVAVYLYYSFRHLHIYRQTIKDRFSSLSKIRLDWLAFMLAFIALIFIMSVIYTFLPATSLREFFKASFVLPFIIIFVFTSSVVWKGLKQPDIFSGIEYGSGKEKKYAASGLSELEKSHISQNLVRLFHEEKTYLIPELTIDQLADKTGTSARKLSQSIHEAFSQNFFDFVNTYRIEAAKAILTESRDPKLTVLEVMYQCGFNSKSSFNTIFKRKEGMTPSEFRRKALEKLPLA